MNINWNINWLIVLVVLVLLLLPLYLFLSAPSLQSLPAPSLLQYFPNGLVYPLLKDTRNTLNVFLHLSKTYGQVFTFWLGPQRVVTTANPQDIAQILSIPKTFARPQAMRTLFQTAIPGSVFCLPQDPHRQTRSVLRENFNHSLLQSFHSHITEAVHELCHNLTQLAQSPSPEQSPIRVDISKQMSVATFRVITNVAFGFPMSRDERLAMSHQVNVFIDELLRDLLGYPLRQILTFTGIRSKLFDSRDNIAQMCKRLLQHRLSQGTQHAKDNPKDILDVLISLQDQQEGALVSNIMVFAVAGSHATNESLSWSLFETCQHPEVVRQIEAELNSQFAHRPLSQPIQSSEVDNLPYLKALWKETLRMHMTGGFFQRVANTDIQLKGSGTTIRKGTMVVALPQAAHTDPDYWTDPEMFNPSRWLASNVNPNGLHPKPGTFVPFSLGPQNCAGRFLADYEAIVVLAELHRRFKFHLACDVEEIRSCTGWVQAARHIRPAAEGGETGLPVYITLREQKCN